jgi:hypothetical protein
MMSDPIRTESREGIGDPNTPVALAVAVVSAIVLVLIVVLLEAYFFKSESDERERKVVAVAPEELSQLRADQLGLLHSYRWIDEKQGVVGIPIERAMELVVAEQGVLPQSASRVVATPRPAR